MFLISAVFDSSKVDTERDRGFWNVNALMSFSEGSQKFIKPPSNLHSAKQSQIREIHSEI